MPVTETLAAQWLELIVDPSWWFNRVIELYASAYWYTGDGDGLLALIEKVCIDCNMAPLQERLARSLTDVYPDPLDQYRLVVSVGASALWYQGHGRRLLDALHATADSPARPSTGTGLSATPEQRERPRHEEHPPSLPRRHLDTQEGGDQ